MTPLKILIIATFFPPVNSIASLRPYSWAKYWSQAGHDVTVLTTEKSQELEAPLSLSPDGFNVVEVPFPRWFESLRRCFRRRKNNDSSKPTGKLRSKLANFYHHLMFEKGILNSCRMPDMTDFWVSSAYTAIKTKGPWDMVISTAGPYTTHLVAHKIKKNKLAKQWIADYRDLWSHHHIYKGCFPFNFIEPLLEKRVLRHADLITTVSSPLAQTITKKFNHPRLHVIENGFDPEDLRSLPVSSIFPEDQQFRIMYTGSFYKDRQNLTPLFDAIKEIYRSDQGYLLEPLEVIFAGPHQAALRQLIHDHQMERWVKVKGFVPRDNALRMQRDAHLLLFLPWNDPSEEGVLTGKIFEYIFSGTPIMALGTKKFEESQRLIIDTQAGEALFSVEEIKSFLLKQLKENRKVKSSVSRDNLQRYTRKHQAEKILEIFGLMITIN